MSYVNSQQGVFSERENGVLVLLALGYTGHVRPGMTLPGSGWAVPLTTFGDHTGR